MNLLLIEDFNTLSQGLPRLSPQAQHIEKILHPQKGQKLLFAIRNKPFLYKAQYAGKTKEKLLWSQIHIWQKSPSLLPCEVLLAINRPLVMKRLLRDLCSLGVSRIHLFSAELSESSYLKSPLFSPESLQKILIEGASQARSSFLPEVTLYSSLRHFFLENKHLKGKQIALDQRATKSLLEERIDHLSQQNDQNKSNKSLLAFSCERGWTRSERNLLEAKNFTWAHLGKRTLRTEAAVLAASVLWIES